MTTEESWHYEVFCTDPDLGGPCWISAFANHGFDRAEATRRMELRKAVAPKSKLRLVQTITTTREYRERNK